MHAVVITFDRLQRFFLGCYGNDWIETPHFDRLAAGGVVFHQHMGENFAPRAASHAWWTGCYQFPRSVEQQRALPPFTRRLSTAGVTSRLLLEEEGDVPAPHDGAFDDVAPISGVSGLDAPPAQTPFARAVTAAIEQLHGIAADNKAPQLVWLKSAGLQPPWLTPRDFAELYRDELEDVVSDEDWEQFLRDRPPEHAAGLYSNGDRRMLDAVYAGGVTFLDVWLGKLLAAVDEALGEEALVIVAAGRGEAWYRSDNAGLPSELVQAPLVIRPPASWECSGGHVQALVQSVDLAPTLWDWFGVPGEAAEGSSLLGLLRGEKSSVRKCACVGDGNGRAGIRTSQFYLTCALADGHDCEPARLFLKPEDVWDVNDVSAQSPDVVEALAGELRQFLRDAGAKP